ncbi:MAG TPA: YncE family protein [Acidimicrobiales bacterium]|nr:YncE family protein [Acidimicrobiales bacterium]
MSTIGFLGAGKARPRQVRLAEAPTRAVGRRLAVALLVLWSLGLQATAEAGPRHLPGATGTVWVTNRTLDNVAVFDAASGQLIATIPVGRDPNSVTIPSATEKAYVSNEVANTVSVISTRSFSVVATIPIPTPGARPHHITSSPNGKFVYVAEFGSNRVAVIDTDTDVVVAEFLTSDDPRAMTHALWVSNDGRTLYAVNSGTDEIVALDALTGQVLWRLPVGDNPSEILVTANQRTAFVSIRGEDRIQVVDLSSRTIVASVPVGDQPDTLRLTNNGKTLVVAVRGSPAEVDLVDTATLAVTRILIAGTTTGHQWLSANGRYTFVAVEGPAGVAGVAVIDNRAAAEVARYPYPGGGRPHGLFYERSRSQ